jgi:hypothetical protein
VKNRSLVDPMPAGAHTLEPGIEEWQEGIGVRRTIMQHVRNGGANRRLADMRSPFRNSRHEFCRSAFAYSAPSGFGRRGNNRRNLRGVASGGAHSPGSRDRVAHVDSFLSIARPPHSATGCATPCGAVRFPSPYLPSWSRIRYRTAVSSGKVSRTC